MGAAGSGNNEVHRLEDIQYDRSDLDRPGPPPDLSFLDFEDWRSAELLRINGISVTGTALLDALRTHDGVLLSAAAYACGSTAVTAAVPLLKLLTDGTDDDAAVEAGFSPVRLSIPEGR